MFHFSDIIIIINFSSIFQVKDLIQENSEKKTWELQGSPRDPLQPFLGPLKNQKFRQISHIEGNVSFG